MKFNRKSQFYEGFSINHMNLPIHPSIKICSSNSVKKFVVYLKQIFKFQQNMIYMITVHYLNLKI